MSNREAYTQQEKKALRSVVNDWNPVLPWIAYFLLGMWMGRLDWKDTAIRRKIFITGAAIFICIEAIQLFALHGYFTENVTFSLTAHYISPFMPFILGTAAFALMLIVVCMYAGDKLSGNKYILMLGKLAK